MRTIEDRNLRSNIKDVLNSLNSKFYVLDAEYFHTITPSIRFQHQTHDVVSYNIRPKAIIGPYAYYITFEVNFKTSEVLYFCSSIKTTYHNIDINNLILTELKKFGLVIAED
jgi:hypothetical protein